MKTIGSTFVRKNDDVFLFLYSLIAKIMRYHVMFNYFSVAPPPLFYSILNKNQLSHIIQLRLTEKKSKICQ